MTATEIAKRSQERVPQTLRQRATQLTLSAWSPYCLMYWIEGEDGQLRDTRIALRRKLNGDTR